LRRDQLLRFVRHGRAVPRPLRPAPCGTRDRRFARPEEDRSSVRWDVPYRRADVRRPPHRRNRPHRRPDDLPGADARADRRRADALMKDIVRSSIAIIALTVFFGLAYPAAMVGFASGVFPSDAGGSLIKRDGTVVGSKLAGQEFKSPRYFHE